MGMFSFLKRQPKAAKSITLATTPDQLAELLRGTWSESSSGEYITPTSAMQCSTVFACVGVLAETVAQLPVRVYRKTADGGRERLPDHPAAKVLGVKPNAWQTPFEFREMQMQHAALRGNAYAFKVLGGGEIMELLPIPSDMVTVEQDANWNLSYRVDFGSNRGGQKIVPASNMMHIRYRTMNGYEGISPIAYQKESIGLAKAAEKHGARLFKNGARPGGILQHPKTMSSEAQERFKASWQAAFTGENTHKTALLEEGMEFKPLTMSQEDAQYLETRRFQVEDIARIYRVPLHEIQANERTTSWGSGIESMNIGFATRTIGPWVKRWEEAAMRDLLTEDERRENNIIIKLSLEGLLRGDAKSRADFYALMVQNKIMTRNEIRVLEDLNPVAGGDEFENPAITPGKDGQEA